jgi:hypothetical protein
MNDVLLAALVAAQKLLEVPRGVLVALDTLGQKLICDQVVLVAVVVLVVAVNVGHVGDVGHVEHVEHVGHVGHVGAAEDVGVDEVLDFLHVVVDVLAQLVVLHLAHVGQKGGVEHDQNVFGALKVDGVFRDVVRLQVVRDVAQELRQKDGKGVQVLLRRGVENADDVDVALADLAGKVEAGDCLGADQLQAGIGDRAVHASALNGEHFGC